MVTILQKVTTFPIEMIELQDFLSIPGQTIRNYYANPTKQIGPITEDEMAILKGSPQTNSTPTAPPTNDKNKIKNRFIVYNSIYNKLFENSLNILEQTKEKTIIVFPTYDQSDKGRIELNPKVNMFYDKFDKIKPLISFDTSANVCYLELAVFDNKKKDEYKNNIKFQFDKIKSSIVEFNTTISNQQKIGKTGGQPIQNILFLLDTDKKGPFTGMYNKQLSQEKKDILNKEYSSFLSSQGFRSKNVDDSVINITYSDIVKQVKNFKLKANIAINTDIIDKKVFEQYIIILKENYKKVTDKEYKKSLELQDNIKKFYIFYKIDNADKVLEDKIQTGPNKLYYIHKDLIGVTVKENGVDKKDENGNVIKKYAHIIGYFTLTSEERGIYRFREDTSQFRIRDATEKAEATTDISKQNTIEDDDDEKNDDTIEKVEGALDFAVKIKNKYGVFQYENLNNDKRHPNGESGIIQPYIDKTEGSFKWFNLRDIDTSLLNKEEIKYYSDILFDKKTLIEYLKSKNKYTDKTILSYEFLKINDSQELSEYCDFIHNRFKSNIHDNENLNPFKSKFTDNTIIKNIMDIVFETNTQIYLRASKVTKEDAREASRDSYKIVEYKLYEDEQFQDETCTRVKGKNTCLIEFNSKDKMTRRVINIVVTKTNIKDSELLKTSTDCKRKKEKLIYNYKKLFANVTRRIATGQYYGGSIKNRKKNKKNKSLKLNKKYTLRKR